MSTTKYTEIKAFLQNEIKCLDAVRETHIPFSSDIERSAHRIEALEYVLNWISDHDEEYQIVPKNLTASIEYEDAVSLVRHMRMAAKYSTSDGEYEKGFFAGWTTACGAILSALGESPSKWVKDEDR